MNFKIGQTVRIKSYKEIFPSRTISPYFVDSMEKYCGKVFVVEGYIEKQGYKIYYLKNNNYNWNGLWLNTENTNILKI